MRSFPAYSRVFASASNVQQKGIAKLPPAGDEARFTFVKPGVIFVGCHLHPNMGAVIVVTPNSWCAMADRTGQFTLNRVPPGSYTVVAWHKAAGVFRQRIQVRDDRAAAVQFVIPLDAPAKYLERFYEMAG